MHGKLVKENIESLDYRRRASTLYYEYPNYNSSNEESLNFKIYVVLEDDLK